MFYTEHVTRSSHEAAQIGTTWSLGNIDDETNNRP